MTTKVKVEFRVIMDLSGQGKKQSAAESGLFY